MSKDKQIEEMTKTILDVDRSYYGMECDEIQAKVEANAIYNAGYRKASEVAEEIFAEIEKILDQKFSINHGVVLISKEEFAELKKKYTESKEKIPPYVRMDAKALPAILNVKYTEEGK
jgi:purine nucleoside permease